jgi:hypothetical protein
MMGYFLTHEGSIRQRKYISIPKWHEKGYKGKGIAVFHDDVEASHSEACVDIIQTILPEARVLSGGISYATKGGEVASCNVRCTETKETLPFDEFIQKHNVTQINNSTTGSSTPAMVEYLKEKIKQYNLFCTGSAGNSGDVSNKYKGAFVMVTGVHFYKDTDRIMSYGSNGDEIDFSMFMGFQMGTSFSAPFLNGMAGLLRSKNPNMTQEEIYDYFKSHSKLLGEKHIYGWGLPIMGEPKTTIKLKVGSKVMTVDGRDVQIDQPPIINKDSWRTLVPVRAIAEAFNAEVKWDEKTQTITIVR